MYGTVTLFGHPFQNVPLKCYRLNGLVRVRSPLLAESLIDFFSSRYLDVSVPWVTAVAGDMASP